ncbi:MAG: hypothetical protein JXA07_02135 [Spirochaetes bacterium]|nr:hypothetical protein [Spirochaetota bacterium]
MRDKQESSFSICRPGFGASCALCCGSHNYRGNHGEIQSLLIKRYLLFKDYNQEFFRRKMTSSRSNLTGSYYYKNDNNIFTLTLPPMFNNCPQCPFLGMADEEHKAVCLLADSDTDHNIRHECFLSYRGKEFICRAKEMLTDNEICYAAIFAGDWYYYSILIHSQNLLDSLMRDYSDPCSIPLKRRELVKRKLEERIRNHPELHSIHSYFS